MLPLNFRLHYCYFSNHTGPRRWLLVDSRRARGHRWHRSFMDICGLSLLERRRWCIIYTRSVVSHTSSSSKWRIIDENPRVDVAVGTSLRRLSHRISPIETIFIRISDHDSTVSIHSSVYLESCRLVDRINLIVSWIPIGSDSIVKLSLVHFFFFFLFVSTLDDYGNMWKLVKNIHICIYELRTYVMNDDLK